MRLPFFLIFAAAALSAACGDPCDPKADVSRCDGNVAVSCPEPGVDQLVGANRWVRHQCEGSTVCVTAGASAFCALSSELSPPCADAGSSVCESATSHLYCHAGFATSRFPCLSCEKTDAGSPQCNGGPSSRCTVNSECAPQLSCNARGFCSTATDGG
jgi:hypothetical protein